MKTIKIGDFLDDAQIQRAYQLYKEATPGTFAKRCREEIIAPDIKRIDEKLGQKNDPSFLAYAIEYVMMKAHHPPWSP